jgi:hypothetical protein
MEFFRMDVLFIPIVNGDNLPLYETREKITNWLMKWFYSPFKKQWKPVEQFYIKIKITPSVLIDTYHVKDGDKNILYYNKYKQINLKIKHTPEKPIYSESIIEYNDNGYHITYNKWNIDKKLIISRLKQIRDDYQFDNRVYYEIKENVISEYDKLFGY